MNNTQNIADQTLRSLTMQTKMFAGAKNFCRLQDGTLHPPQPHYAN